MTMTHLISKWSILGVVATLMVAFGALMLTTNIGAHSGKGPAGEIGIHVCVQEVVDSATSMFRIDETGDCDNLEADTARHWLSGEAIISGLGGLAGTGSVTNGLAGLLTTHTSGAWAAGDLDIIAAMDAEQGDAFVYVFLSSGGFSGSTPRQDFIDGGAGDLGIATLGTKINAARVLLELAFDTDPELAWASAAGDAGDTWANQVLRSLADGVITTMDSYTGVNGVEREDADGDGFAEQFSLIDCSTVGDVLKSTVLATPTPPDETGYTCDNRVTKNTTNLGNLTAVNGVELEDADGDPDGFNEQISLIDCALDEILKSDGIVTGDAEELKGADYRCADDENDTYTNGTGLDLTGPQPDEVFSINVNYRLPQGCTANQVAKLVGGVWVCRDDLTSASGPSIIGGSATAKGGTVYFGLFHTAEGSIEQVYTVMPAAGKLQNFNVRLDKPVFGNKSWTFTVWKKPVAGSSAATLVSCSISASTSSNIQCIDDNVGPGETDGVVSVGFVAGDLIAVEARPSASNDNKNVVWTAEYAAP